MGIFGMKITTKFKICFDTLLFVLFILDYNTMMRFLGGIFWHEISGLFFGGLLVIHMIIDWSWIKYVTIHLFQAKLRSKSGLQYWIDVLLFLMIVYIFVSGIGCSDVLFPNWNFGDLQFMKHSHKIVSFLALIVLGVHLGLNWKWILLNAKKIFGITGTGKAARFFGQLAVVSTLALGVYFGTVSGFYRRIFHINQFYDKTFEYPMVGLAKPEFSYHPLYIIVVYTSITAIFVILTYYVEKSISESKTN
jgi:hypothetical protein